MKRDILELAHGSLLIDRSKYPLKSQNAGLSGGLCAVSGKLSISSPFLTDSRARLRVEGLSSPATPSERSRKTSTRIERAKQILDGIYGVPDVPIEYSNYYIGGDKARLTNGEADKCVALAPQPLRKCWTGLKRVFDRVESHGDK